ncbi:MAG: hypothetical protein ACE5H3_08190 [Planctomycetota bacterium]
MKTRTPVFFGIPARSLRSGLLLGLFLLFAAPAPAQEPWEHGDRGDRPEQREEIQHLIQVLHGLEQGMEALDRLGAEEELHALARIADDVRGELEHLHEGMRGDRPRGWEERGDRHDRGPGERERQAVRQQIHLMQAGAEALEREGRHDAADVLERMTKSRELALEGRNGPDVREFRGHLPGPGDQAEILAMAARLMQEQGRREAGTALERMAGRLMEHVRATRQGRGGHEDHGEDEGRGGGEREAVMHQIETLEMALSALREAEKGDLAEMAERSIQVRQTLLEGRRDREAREIREHAPEPGQEAEILMFAAHLFEDQFDDPGRAEEIRERTGHLWGRWIHPREEDHGDRGRMHEEGEDERHEVFERLEWLQDRLEELAEAVGEIEEQLDDLRREIG